MLRIEPSLYHSVTRSTPRLKPGACARRSVKAEEASLLDYLVTLAAKEYVVYNHPRSVGDELGEEMVRMLVPGPGDSFSEWETRTRGRGRSVDAVRDLPCLRASSGRTATVMAWVWTRLGGRG
ncbi:MAG: hypothetical protein ACYCUD_02950 [Candidatus Dormibacteria bacterium]